jgi:hypothetical protein
MFAQGACGVEITSAFPSILLLDPGGGVLAGLDYSNIISVHAILADSPMEVDPSIC